MRQSAPFRAGIIGLGHQATDKHIPGFLASDKAHLVAVCDSDIEIANIAGVQLGVSAYCDYKELLRSEELDFIVIATPHDLHRPIIEAAAVHGVHVLKEKPFAVSLDEAVRITEIAESSGINIMTMMQRRLHPVYQSFSTLRQHIGRPFFVDAKYHFFTAHPGAGWRGDARRAGGGCILDMGYHLIDIIIWYFGLPDWISCNLSASAEPTRVYDAEDTATIQFSYRSGLHGILTLSRFYSPKTEAVVIVGSEGQLTLDPISGSATVFMKGNRAKVYQCVPMPRPNALIDHFCGVLAGEIRSIGLPDEHLQHLKFINACYRERSPLAPEWEIAPEVNTNEACTRH